MMRFALLAISLVACGGTITDIDGGTDSGGNDASFDHVTEEAPPSFSCGIDVCSGFDAVCIHGCCGGAMICEALTDGGVCPQGESLSQQCPPDQPCTYVCTPPPPYCGTTKDCSMGNGHDCYLLCQ